MISKPVYFPSRSCSRAPWGLAIVEEIVDNSSRRNNGNNTTLPSPRRSLNERSLNYSVNGLILNIDGKYIPGHDLLVGTPGVLVSTHF